MDLLIGRTFRVAECLHDSLGYAIQTVSGRMKSGVDRIKTLEPTLNQDTVAVGFALSSKIVYVPREYQEDPGRRLIRKR